jgi:hypothetical protein
MPKDKEVPNNNELALANIQLEAERLKAETEQHNITVKGNVASQAIRWGGMVAICVCGVLCIHYLSGRNTIATITIDVLAKFYLPWIGAAGGIIYGKAQEKAKRDQLQKDSKRIAELEKRIDANRTSSNLTERGQTRPEDKI